MSSPNPHIDSFLDQFLTRNTWKIVAFISSLPHQRRSVRIPSAILAISQVFVLLEDWRLTLLRSREIQSRREERTYTTEHRMFVWRGRMMCVSRREGGGVVRELKSVE
jgi:hypothetical protein